MPRYRNPVPSGTIGRTDQGVDISAPPGTPVVAIGESRFVGTLLNWFKGQSFSWFELLNKGRPTGQYWYGAEQISWLPLRRGQVVSAGQEVGTIAPSGTGTEFGWATRTGQTLAAATTGYKESQATRSGLNFRRAVLSGATPETETLSQLWTQAGGPPNVANLMGAIALAESKGRLDAVTNEPNGTKSYSFWQINSVHTQFDPQRLTSDPLYSARAAVSVYKSEGLKAWTTYNTGAYRQYLSQGATATPMGSGPEGGKVRPGGEGNEGSTIMASWDSSLNPFSGAGWESLNPFSEIEKTIKDVDGFVSFISWIFTPLNLLRGVEFLTGIAMMVFGLILSIQQVRVPVADAARTIVSATPPGRVISRAAATTKGYTSTRKKIIETRKTRETHTARAKGSGKALHRESERRKRDLNKRLGK